VGGGNASGGKRKEKAKVEKGKKKGTLATGGEKGNFEKEGDYFKSRRSYTGRGEVWEEKGAFKSSQKRGKKLPKHGLEISAPLGGKGFSSTANNFGDGKRKALGDQEGGGDNSMPQGNFLFLS